MRNMSFALTTEAARKKTKTVTRRLKWDGVNPGTRIQQVVKGMGLKKGEHAEKIHVIEIVSVILEPLDRMNDSEYGGNECVREGFVGMSGPEFVRMFCAHNGCQPDTLVNRIEFKYVEGSEVCQD